MSEERDMDNVALMPRWKQNASPGDTLRELALIADKNPEYFRRWVIIYCEEEPAPSTGFVVRHMYGNNMRTADVFGVLGMGTQHIWDRTQR